jgi:hypothetical protein
MPFAFSFLESDRPQDHLGSQSHLRQDWNALETLDQQLCQDQPIFDSSISLSFNTSLYQEPFAGHPSIGSTRRIKHCSLSSLLFACHCPRIWIACQRHWTHSLLGHCSSCIATVASLLRDIDRSDGSHTFVGEAKSASNLIVRSTCAGIICWTTSSLDLYYIRTRPCYCHVHRSSSYHDRAEGSLDSPHSGRLSPFPLIC